MSRDLCLVTIPFSHYCEKARWILERAGLSFEERGYMPVLHMSGTLPLGGRSVPLLRAGSACFTDSTDIALYVDSLVGEEARLYPADQSTRTEALALEDSFDRRLGPHSRRWVYFHVLANRDRALEFMRPFGTETEIKVFGAAFPLLSRMMKAVMKITPESAERSLRYARDSFASVSERLSDGRRFLLGDRLSIADVTFAALGAPLVFPSNYGGSTQPGMPEVPAPLATEVESFRKTPAGQFVLRLYDEHRLERALASS
jgi:glutathione S-transferase